jgi:hypothetical protein
LQLRIANPIQQNRYPIAMEQLSTFEMIMLGAVALGVLFWAGPGVKAMLEQSRQAENKDWAGALLPIIIVVIFVLLLIKMV